MSIVAILQREYGSIPWVNISRLFGRQLFPPPNTRSPIQDPPLRPHRRYGEYPPRPSSPSDSHSFADRRSMLPSLPKRSSPWPSPWPALTAFALARAYRLRPGPRLSPSPWPARIAFALARAYRLRPGPRVSPSPWPALIAFALARAYRRLRSTATDRCQLRRTAIAFRTVPQTEN
jgi:hypothetical protein